MTAVDRDVITAVLGPDIADIATELEHRSSADSWRHLLALLYRQHPEAMSTRIGQRFTFAACLRLVASSDAVDADGSGDVYQGVELDGADRAKLVALADRLLFYCRVARLRTRPVKITEAEGCVKLTWSRYAPRVFRGRLLDLISDGRCVDTLTVQDSETISQQRSCN